MFKCSSRCLVLALLLGTLGVLLSACPATSDSLILVGSPTVSASFIDSVLSHHHSPATGLGQTFYTVGASHNIDPVYALAFFHYESDYGLKGEAVQSLSIGNVGCMAGYTCRDGFAWFPSWASGIKAWYTLIAGSMYVGSGLTTVSKVVQRYAPSSDSNDEQAYVQSVTQDVESWRSGQDSY